MKLSSDRRKMSALFLREMADLIEQDKLEINTLLMHHNQCTIGETDNMKLGITFTVELNADIERKCEHLDLVNRLDE